MAGRPILRAYLALVEKIGIQTILNRLAEGESITAVARTIGTSRCFLSTFLNATPEGVEALAIARQLAAESRQKSGCGTRSESYGWAKDAARPHLNDWITTRLSLTHNGPRGAERASANHLAAHQQLQAERATHGQHQLAPTPQGLPFTPANISAALAEMMGPRMPVDPG